VEENLKAEIKKHLDARAGQKTFSASDLSDMFMHGYRKGREDASLGMSAIQRVRKESQNKTVVMSKDEDESYE
jgi:hypothetical protein